MTTETGMTLTQDDLENILVKGDLGALNAEQRTRYYEEICKALKLNPLTVPAHHPAPHKHLACQSQQQSFYLPLSHYLHRCYLSYPD